MRLERGKIYKSKLRLEKEYSISFDVFPVTFDDDFMSVIHFTVNTESPDGNSLGDRVPAVFFWRKTDFSGNESVRTLFFNFNNISFHTTQKYATGSWYHVQLEQVESNGKYIFKVSVNGDVIQAVTNKNPETYEDVTVYTSNPWETALDGYIYNMHIVSGEQICIYNFVLEFTRWDPK